ncbi:hypothetical protein [Levilactobacillus enshiensis]|uniref:hypothetical protein n=1 Tax=Levilactobacillus enshiensis TaxID=2590213 RepID=UPI001179CD31|nr:hypothetical protein [Levilactobacillus enshiensis]
MKQFNVQLAGADFVPLLPWSTAPSAAVHALAAGGVDLLLLDEENDLMKIVPQRTLEELMPQLENSVYGRLFDQVATLIPQASQELLADWYLAIDLAQASHINVITTAANLVALAVLRLKGVPVTADKVQGVASQAQCWLLQAQLTEHQLFLPAGKALLQRLFTHLLDQHTVWDTYTPDHCNPHAGRLAQDVYALTCGNLLAIQLPAAWSLVRVAALENHLLR